MELHMENGEPAKARQLFMTLLVFSPPSFKPTLPLK